MKVFKANGRNLCGRQLRILSRRNGLFQNTSTEYSNLHVFSVPFTQVHFRYKQKQLVSANDPDFISVIDTPERIVSARQKHGPGLIILGWF